MLVFSFLKDVCSGGMVGVEVPDSGDDAAIASTLTESQR